MGIDMEFEKLIYRRRSTRGFTGKPLTDDQIQKLLHAAVNAPNACNLQSWHFYCVCDRVKIEGLVPEVYGGAWIKNAGAIFVICTDAQKLAERFGERGDKLFCIQDTACAADHMLLMAAELGLDGCFVGAFDEDNCRKYLNIPANQRPVIILPIGYASAEFPKKPRKNIDGVVTFVGKNKPVFDEQNGTPFRLYDRNLPGAVFEKLNLSGAVIKNCNLQDVQIEDCDVSNMTLNGAPINK